MLRSSNHFTSRTVNNVTWGAKPVATIPEAPDLTVHDIVDYGDWSNWGGEAIDLSFRVNQEIDVIPGMANSRERVHYELHDFAGGSGKPTSQWGDLGAGINAELNFTPMQALIGTTTNIARDVDTSLQIAEGMGKALVHGIFHMGIFLSPLPAGNPIVPRLRDIEFLVKRHFGITDIS